MININDTLGPTDLCGSGRKLININDTLGPTDLCGSGRKLMNINDTLGPTDLCGSGHKLMNINNSGPTEIRCFRTQVDEPKRGLMITKVKRMYAGLDQKLTQHS